MNKTIEPPQYNVFSFIPPNFFKKEVNEEFIKLVMRSVLPNGKWIKGNANKHEPDYIYDGVPFEFTIASDKCKNKRKNNFINKLRTIGYTSNNTENDLIEYIKEQVETKANKKYSLKNVHLCILSLIQKIDWVFDEYGSCLYFLIEDKRKNFFKELKEKYIKTNIFSNIFIIFPDMNSNWWVWDIDSDCKVSLLVTPEMIESKKFPYFIEKRLYTKLINENLLEDIFQILK